MVDIAGSSATTTSIAVGGSITNSLEVSGDHDWIRITLTAGQAISISLSGSGATPLDDPYLILRDSAGNQLASNDDGGAGLNSLLNFTATSSGTYYIDVGAYTDPDPAYAPGSGGYTLSVSPYTPPPVYNYDQIANYLTDGYWEGARHHFNVAPGGTLTVNVTALTAAGQTLALQALAMWTDVTGINFSRVTSGGQIVFDDNDTGAYADYVASGQITTSAHVNVSTQWLTDYGTGFNSYSFQTYIHEIGHALGLGHGGNYNGDATYPNDAVYANDAWSTTVMSYFDQADNSYFAGQSFSRDFILTPMIADVVAMQSLYGLSTTTRTGDTTYGFGNNSGRIEFDALANPIAYTIVDSGGTDTLDYSGYSAIQRINLNVETFSNVGGDIGNVSIGRGTVIENAIGGSGADTIIGNDVANVLTGGLGNDDLQGGNGDDTLIGGTGNDRLDGGAGVDTVTYAGSAAALTVNLAAVTAQNTVAQGLDTFVSVENVIGTAYNDRMTGDANANTLVGDAGGDALSGGAGNDRLDGGIGNDTLNGDAGNDTLLGGDGTDTLLGGAGDDIIDGGSGIDILSYASSTTAVTVDLSVTAAQNTVGAGNDTISGVEYLSGSKYNDTLTGDSGANTIAGGTGNDVIHGGAGNDRLDGGAGTDTLDGGFGTDTATYAAAAAAVTVNLSLTTIQQTGGGGLDLLTSIESLIGSNLNDVLTGSSASNGLNGGAGDDLLSGGLGKDSLTGGAGMDSFRFDSALNATTNVDTITDFNSADDTFILSKSVFAGIATTGTLAASAFQVGTAANDALDRIIYNQATGYIYYDADGTGAAAATLFARVTAGTILSNVDFSVVSSAATLDSKSAQTSAMPLASDDKLVGSAMVADTSLSSTPTPTHAIAGLDGGDPLGHHLHLASIDLAPGALHGDYLLA